VLNHSLSKFVNIHLYHPRQWFNMHLVDSDSTALQIASLQLLDGRTEQALSPAMLVLGLDLGLGPECSGLGINNKANRHII